MPKVLHVYYKTQHEHKKMIHEIFEIGSKGPK